MRRIVCAILSLMLVFTVVHAAAAMAFDVGGPAVEASAFHDRDEDGAGARHSPEHAAEENGVCLHRCHDGGHHLLIVLPAQAALVSLPPIGGGGAVPARFTLPENSIRIDRPPRTA